MSTARLTLAAATLALLVTLAVLTFASGADDRRAGPAHPRTVAPPDGTTNARIAQQQALVREHPKEADGYVGLAAAMLQKVRESGDASYYTRAQAAITRALAVEPDDPGALTERGALKLARHDFRGALVDGRRAHALVPEVVRPYGVMVDALVELGRYDAAERTLQRMVDLKPDLASYARVSYVRELNGDVTGALKAMRLAVAVGGAAPENVASVSVLYGNLEFAHGRYAKARVAYERALSVFEGYVPALAGLANTDASAGRLGRAISGLRRVVERLPLPQYVVALGEAELAAGRPADARHDLELVRAQERLLRAAGVNTDVDLALFEADHGDARRAVALARSAWAAAPSVRSADAMAWALTRAERPQAALAWVPKALKLGSRDPTTLFHAGMTARAAGRPASARRWLRAALSASPHFSPWRVPQARRALRELG